MWTFDFNLILLQLNQTDNALDTESNVASYVIFFPDLRAHNQNSPQAIEPSNDEPTCPTVQSTQIITEREETGEV